MTPLAALGLAAAIFGSGEALARQRTTLAAFSGTILAFGAFLLVTVRLGPAGPAGEVAPLLVLLLGAATVLSRPPTWREPPELARLAETTLLVAACFLAGDERATALLWLLSLLPGLRLREARGFSRRPFALLVALAATPVATALGVRAAWPDAPHGLTWVAVVAGAAVRMGVPPFHPLVHPAYDRLPMGRTALVAAARPSVALVLAARGVEADAIAWAAPGLQAWAAVAAAASALQGLAAESPRRAIGAMATTQASVILYGLCSPGVTGVDGALVQWAGLGLALLGLGILVEAAESRLGRTRAVWARGLSTPAPGMAVLFLVFAATLSGFPGTTGFVGEDLVMQAQTSHPLVWRPLLLAATALNGITMIRMFARTFLGPVSPPEAGEFPPLGPRERLVLGAIAAATALLAASPGLVTG